MTARAKLTLLVAALTCATFAVWGAKQIVSGLYDPIIKALGG